MSLSHANYGASAPRPIIGAFAFCFTINNPTYNEWYKLNSLLTSTNDYGIFYYGYGMENWEQLINQKPDKGQFHLQGLIVSDRKLPLKLMKHISRRAHWEPMATDLKTCVLYCSKEGKFVSMGDYKQAHLRLYKSRKAAEYKLYPVKQYDTDDTHAFMSMAMFGSNMGDVGLDFNPDYTNSLHASVHHKVYLLHPHNIL